PPAVRAATAPWAHASPARRRRAPPAAPPLAVPPPARRPPPRRDPTPNRRRPQPPNRSPCLLLAKLLPTLRSQHAARTPGLSWAVRPTRSVVFRQRELPVPGPSGEIVGLD